MSLYLFRASVILYVFRYAIKIFFCPNFWKINKCDKEIKHLLTSKRSHTIMLEFVYLIESNLYKFVLIGLINEKTLQHTLPSDHRHHVGIKTMLLQACSHSTSRVCTNMVHHPKFFRQQPWICNI